jgi:hypothetical protein
MTTTQEQAEKMVGAYGAARQAASRYWDDREKLPPPLKRELDVTTDALIAALTAPVVSVTKENCAHVWRHRGPQHSPECVKCGALQDDLPVVSVADAVAAEREAIAELLERLHAEDAGEYEAVAEAMSEAFNDGEDKSLSMNEKLRLHIAPAIAAIRARGKGGAT